MKVESTSKQKVCQDPDERGGGGGIQTGMTGARKLNNPTSNKTSGH